MSIFFKGLMYKSLDMSKTKVQKQGILLHTLTYGVQIVWYGPKFSRFDPWGPVWNIIVLYGSVLRICSYESYQQI